MPLGTTWFRVMREPDQAAHVLGKLLAHLGEDNVVWGTDSIWYGSPQPQIDAFRAFTISEEFQERFGYPPLTDAVKAKVLGLNGARVYGVEPVRTACS
jgi:predicted TIM-barrel fold metal-dependent hydrolase